jgi:hypothetical protein
MTKTEVADLWAHAQKQWPKSPALQAQLVASIKVLKQSEKGWVLEPRNRVQRKTTRH